MEVIARLSQHLQCPLCLGPYKDPRTLPCFHSFCLSCLDQLMIKYGKRPGEDITTLMVMTTMMSCPVCRHLYLYKKPSQLPANFLINNLQNALDEEARAIREQSNDQRLRCDLCQETPVATTKCLDCTTFLCKHHTDLHAKYHHQTVQVSLTPTTTTTTINNSNITSNDLKNLQMEDSKKVREFAEKVMPSSTNKELIAMQKLIKLGLKDTTKKTKSPSNYNNNNHNNTPTTTTYQVFIKTLESKTLTLSVHKDLSIKQLKEMVSERISVGSRLRYMLHYSGKTLEEHRPLAFYDVNKDATIHMRLGITYTDSKGQSSNSNNNNNKRH